MSALLTGTMIRDGLKAGTITQEAALARCDEILGRADLSANKRARWARIKADVVANVPVNIAAAYASMPAAKPAKAKPAKAKAAKPAKADDVLTELAKRMKAEPALMAAFVQLLAK